MDGWRPQRSEPQQHQEQFFSIWRTRTRWNRKSHTKEIEFDKPHIEQNLVEHLAVCVRKCHQHRSRSEDSPRRSPSMTSVHRLQRHHRDVW